MSVRKTVIRCDQNKYKTPLFSYDNLGIFIRCKDCRTEDPVTHEQRRGPFHLITWAQLAALQAQAGEDMKGFIVGDKYADGTSVSYGTGSVDGDGEGVTNDSGGSGRGGEGSRLDGERISVSVSEVTDIGFGPNGRE